MSSEHDRSTGTEQSSGVDSEPAASEGEPLVRIRELKKHFETGTSILDRLFGEESQAVRAVDGISLDIHEGETLGLVGESGCGKSTAGETILRLQEPTSGTVEFDGTPLGDRKDLTEFRSRAQIVFQDPFSSLDPRMTVGASIRQPLEIHNWKTRQERRERSEELIERVGLSASELDRYPGEFSGGQRQRIGIARALALDPDFIVLDEPTSALDVSVQAQILNLLDELQEDFNLTYLFISHDLGVIRHICDRIAVMYLGEIVEVAPAEELFSNPQHPYTEALLESVPRVDLDEQNRDIDPLSGDVPSPRNPPSGCRFRTRCPKIIPPETVDLSQEQFRAVMDVRDRIENRQVGLEQIRERIADDFSEDTPDEELHEAVVERVYDRLVEAELPSADESRLREAVELVVDEQWEAAASQLRSEYETICETEKPEGERAACHLLDGEKPRRP